MAVSRQPHRTNTPPVHRLPLLELNQLVDIRRVDQVDSPVVQALPAAMVTHRVAHPVVAKDPRVETVIRRVDQVDSDHLAATDILLVDLALEARDLPVEMDIPLVDLLLVARDLPEVVVSHLEDRALEGRDPVQTKAIQAIDRLFRSHFPTKISHKDQVDVQEVVFPRLQEVVIPRLQELEDPRHSPADNSLAVAMTDIQAADLLADKVLREDTPAEVRDPDLELKDRQPADIQVKHHTVRK